MGQFRTAGGLALLGGRSWGLRFPAALSAYEHGPFDRRVTSNTNWRFTPCGAMPPPTERRNRIAVQKMGKDKN